METNHSTNHNSENSAEEKLLTEGHHFTVPFSALRNVALALIGLTILTVITARMHLGVMAAPIAFLIAAIKAYMVMGWFMGLKFDAKLNRIIFSLGFIFLGVFYFFCAVDILTRIKEMSTL
jgi:cytochrome c oxidase subunit IV